MKKKIGIFFLKIKIINIYFLISASVMHADLCRRRHLSRRGTFLDFAIITNWMMFHSLTHTVCVWECCNVSSNYYYNANYNTFVSLFFLNKKN